ncbi:hypothetical protein [Arcanobacterium hippocoleae]|uniref:Uncharacterized protein n=1 Tax=Arcanobacterium hippocoleae TaxID=149017 RepID=A0ABU1T1S4_9ACTO|nr:hypothetical protein [Arcanobacterium hippocoleae]MDR6939325.1 hypothetical protein [Arcanobacterium hippocoleae]
MQDTYILLLLAQKEGTGHEDLTGKSIHYCCNNSLVILGLPYVGDVSKTSIEKITDFGAFAFITAAGSHKVVDYLDTVYPEVDHSGWDIDVIPSLDGLSTQIEAAKSATLAAAKAQEAAAAQTRAVVHNLLAAGVTSSDAAVIMGVSRGRISQLAKS